MDQKLEVQEMGEERLPGHELPSTTRRFEMGQERLPAHELPITSPSFEMG
jgi:hypothetical protein